MTELQKRFVAELMITPQNAAAAYRRAGGTGKNSDVNAAVMLRHADVKAEIAKRQTKLHNRYEVSAENVLRELTLMGYANLDDYTDIVTDDVTGEKKRVLNIAKPTRDQMAAVAEITEDATGGSGDGERRAVLRTRFKMHDKTKALELLGKHLKLFTDVVKHEGLESLVTILGEKES